MIHIRTADIYMKVISDRRSEFPIEAIGMEKPEKYRCDALPTEL